MENNKRSELIQKIIREQDIVALYAIIGCNKSVDMFEEYYGDCSYYDLKKFILSEPEIMDDFSIKNLYLLLTCAIKEEDKELINEKILTKLENEEFFCEDIDSAPFIVPIHTNNIYSLLNKETQKKINEKNIR